MCVNICETLFQITKQELLAIVADINNNDTKLYLPGKIYTSNIKIKNQ